MILYSRKINFKKIVPLLPAPVAGNLPIVYSANPGVSRNLVFRGRVWEE